jgi:hypothetical protein
LLDVLAPASASGPSESASESPATAAQEPTDAGVATTTAALLGAGWLPSRVIAAIAHQSAAVLSAEISRADVSVSWQD